LAASAVFPSAETRFIFPELLDEGLEAHKVKEVWLPGFDNPDHYVDATGLIDKKMEAILCHRSQFEKPGVDLSQAGKWLRERMRVAGEKAGFEYAEAFRKLQTG